MAFYEEYGAKLADGVKFCEECGTIAPATNQVDSAA